MKLRTRTASWFVSGLLLVTVVSFGFQLVVAQPQGETSRPAFDTRGATFELLGENIFVNINNIAYTSYDERKLDIYFACSSTRGSDPLRLTNAKDIKKAELYFGDEKHYGKRFVKINKYYINLQHIAYIESKDDSMIIYFNARITDSFVYLALVGADAAAFRDKMRGF